MEYEGRIGMAARARDICRYSAHARIAETHRLNSGHLRTRRCCVLRDKTGPQNGLV